jgi:hypothetical protein
VADLTVVRPCTQEIFPKSSYPSNQFAFAKQESMVRNQGRVTRFVVMAILQAARAESLGLPHESALSWGLNRAIFYAAAKRGFKEGPSKSGEKAGGSAGGQARELFRLGEDEAYRNPNVQPITFTIGDQDQTAADFERQVVPRFGTKTNFQKAWDEAIRIVTRYDRATLESRERFYGEVYKPRRDALSDSWTQEYSPVPKAR